MPHIASIQIGQAAKYTYDGATDGKSRDWTTAFFKTSVVGEVRVGQLGIAGDQQADLRNHGGLDKAVLAYSADHYPFWRERLSLPDLPHGGFGENLTITGSEESTVCIGDRWQAGGVLFEVSQPRQPCWKMARRWQIVDLPKQVIHNGRSGWYLRVLEAGALAAGTPLELVSRPRPTWTIARANQLLYHEPDQVAALEELANVPELSRAWREELLDKIVHRAL
jgi:MOSC domain-containing protein YiiM